ncbi:MAG: WG repeat-containing protein [Clostridia bacterium]|nr:WG repeat-containing protein [Clostridia bacterium]
MAESKTIWAYQDTVAYYEQDGKIGLIGLEMTVLTPPVFDEVTPFVDGIATVRQDGKWGVINQQGEWVFELKANGKISFYEGIGRLMENHQFWYIDMQGNEVVAPQWYIWALDVSHSLFVADKGEGKGYMNLQGKVEIPFIWDDASSFSEGLAMVEKDGLHGFINIAGEVVIPLQYHNARGFSGGLAGVLPEINGDWVFIDQSGEVHLRGNWDSVGYFGDNGLAPVSIDQMWGYINQKGTLVIEPQWEKAWPFSDGLASASVDGYTGFINAQGDYELPPQWISASPFANGYAHVWDGWSGYINTSGEIVCRTVERMVEGISPNAEKVSGDYTFIVEDGTAAIIDYVDRGRETILSIPDMLDGMPVVAIGEGVFWYSNSINSIVIPEGLILIGPSAFYGCENLAFVIIPTTVELIGEDAFAHCPNLTLRVSAGSYAARYAEEKGIPFQIE